MSILVTGGAGFIGSHLLDRLCSAGRRVVCLDNFNDFYNPRIKRSNLQGALSSGLVELVEGDIREPELCRRVLQEHHIECVVHLAAMAGVRPSIERPLLYEEVNCRGTLNLLEAAREAGVSKFVFGSSSSVYGSNRKVPFSEDDPVGQPISPYGATKRSGELFCYTYHNLYGISMVCLRFFTVYGPRQRPDLAIHKFTALIEKGEPLPVFGDGSSSRDYTHVSDIVNGIMAAIDRSFDFEIINLGNSRPITLNDLIRLLENAMGKNARIEHLPLQSGDMKVTYADVSKARRLLDWEPRLPIEKGIEDFVRWFKETYRTKI